MARMAEWIRMQIFFGELLSVKELVLTKNANSQENKQEIALFFGLSLSMEREYLTIFFIFAIGRESGLVILFKYHFNLKTYIQ